MALESRPRTRADHASTGTAEVTGWLLVGVSSSVWRS